MASAPGLRPTPDRVRETLFNWLTPRIAGARCLDCYAGTGALGLEALSRGALSVVFVEQDAALAEAIRNHVRMLAAAGAAIVCADAQRWLASHGDRFDIIFLDPPFRRNLATEACVQIANKGHLAPGGRVYAETERGWIAPPPLQTVRQGKAGQVQYQLLSAGPESAHESHGNLSGDL